MVAVNDIRLEFRDHMQEDFGKRLDLGKRTVKDLHRATDTAEFS